MALIRASTLATKRLEAFGEIIQMIAKEKPPALTHRGLLIS
ncbi:hypothetical protein [Marivita cryptomonadis]|nr:hypothetical protein [Marivita cryptomonadis]